jgi:hypothetical protein
VTAPIRIARRQHEALTELTAILEKHDPEVGARVAKANHGGSIPNPVKNPLESNAFLAECILSLARIVDDLVEQSKPRPRGRPRKAAAS